MVPLTSPLRTQTALGILIKSLSLNWNEIDFEIYVNFLDCTYERVHLTFAHGTKVKLSEQCNRMFMKIFLFVNKKKI